MPAREQVIAQISGKSNVVSCFWLWHGPVLATVGISRWKKLCHFFIEKNKFPSDDKCLPQCFRYHLGHLNSISKCLGSRLGPASESSFLIACSPRRGAISDTWAPANHIQDSEIKLQAAFLSLTQPSLW